MTTIPHDARAPHADLLHGLQALLLGLLFLSAIVLLSFPAARGTSAVLGWTPLWLLGLPAASLLATRLLAWSQARGTPAPARAPAMPRRRRPAMAVSRRRPPSRRGARLLAALALR